MCDMCGEDGQKGRDNCLRIADDLRRLAAMYSDLGCGRMKPHTDDMKAVQLMARSVIRDLVQDHV